MSLSNRPTEEETFSDDVSRCIRKRPHQTIVDTDSEESTTASDNLSANSAHRTKRQRFSHVSNSDLGYPKSLYVGHKSPFESTSEKDAVKDLLLHFGQDDKQYISLRDFSIYRPFNASKQPGTLAPLNDLLTRAGNNAFYFNGILRVGTSQHYVEGVPFEIVSVEGYDDENVTVKNGIYIQSKHLQGSDVWYRLETPAKEYARFHDAYLWLADFCKHFVSYILAHDGVRLHDFRSRFNAWIHRLHGKSDIFRTWHAAYSRSDFCTVVAAHYEYLWKESTLLGGHDALKVRRQFLWREVDNAQLSAVPEQPYDLDGKTEVTPYVYELFKHMYFGDQLVLSESTQYVQESTRHIEESTQHIETTTDGNKSQYMPSDLASPPAAFRPRGVGSVRAGSARIGDVGIGDIVCVARDEDGHWKDQESTWFAYVHDTERHSDGRVQLHVFWLYRPSETTCGTMRYPFHNELFFSDHCNCHCSKAARIFAHDVHAKPAVRMFANSADTASTYFIRQTYITEENVNHFITLQKSHLRCEHRSGKPAIPLPHLTYSLGDTVLIQLQGQTWLEPASIVRFTANGKYVEVRTFLRRARDLCEEDASPNEIVSTRRSISVPSTHIKRPCQIRYYSKNDAKHGRVPMPYSLGGVGDHWIATGEVATDGSLERCTLPLDFNEGYNPKAASAEQQHVLDLFSGSGSFGRGIEAGRAAKVKWAVDIDKYAIHTKHANLDDVDGTALYYGSAVEYFKRAAAGRFSKLIAFLGAVHMIIAGSPCQGFSLLQEDAASARSRRNASMVALVVAFVDLYRPKYALLENVFGMTRKFGPNKDEDVFAQIVCALVGLGYQCRYFLVEAYSHGGPQNRTRIFISIAAPGLTPIECPPTTHRAPENVQIRGIGRSLAGVTFGSRVLAKTPFPYVSADEATRDLPGIGDAAIGVCVPFPDHRMSRMPKLQKRLLLRSIPSFPYSQGLVQAAKRIPKALFGVFENRVFTKGITHPKIWSRVNPTGIFDTVTTTAKPDDIKSGRWLHWDQPRTTTVMEVRRAQSFPDDTVLIGLPAQQYKLVGNAVSFNVATALGVRLREALVKNAASACPTPVQQRLGSSKPVAVGNGIKVIVREAQYSAPMARAEMTARPFVEEQDHARHRREPITRKPTKGFVNEVHTVVHSTFREVNGTRSIYATTSHTEMTVRVPAKPIGNTPKQPTIVLLEEGLGTSDSDSDSEDELSFSQAGPASRSADRTKAPPITAQRTADGLLPIKWPRSQPLSRAEFAAAVAHGHHFAKYMTVEGE